MQPLQIGVCSWSLKIADLDQTLSTIKNELGLKLVQLGFFDDSYKNTDQIMEAVKASGLEVSTTCIGFEGEDYSSIPAIAKTGGYIPDDDWDNRLAKTLAVADLTAKLGVKLLAAHIGFVPHDSSDPKYAIMVDRIKRICDELGQRGLILIMETGQEKAKDLIEFIDAVSCDNIAINFDSANMILYGIGEPLEAIDILKDKIIHVHMKDATWSDKPGQQWGEEVVLGTGQSDIPGIVNKLKRYGYTGPLVIEREVGDTPTRLADIKQAIKLLRSL
ncbi:MAG: sugar phosphate isomerase/epimerase [Planctomycetota bacterium]|nr:MAG: sugar phosphate isomerase/epimerase [Planctomycetota bacterium]